MGVVASYRIGCLCLCRIIRVFHFQSGSLAGIFKEGFGISADALCFDHLRGAAAVASAMRLWQHGGGLSPCSAGELYPRVRCPLLTTSKATPHTVHALSTECSKPRENSVQSAQLQLLHSVRSAQECTEDLSALSAECFWRSVFQAKCTVHGSRPAVRTRINVVQTREFRVGGGSKRC